MKLNLSKTVAGAALSKLAFGVKKCTNHSKNPRLSKDGKRIIRGRRLQLINGIWQ